MTRSHVVFSHDFDGDYTRVRKAARERLQSIGVQHGFDLLEDVDIDVFFPAGSEGPYSSTRQVTVEVKVTWW